MGIVERARTLESRISRALSQAAENAVGSSVREPLEIVHAIVGEAERQIVSAGRGARVFPFNRIDVEVVASSVDARARLEAVLCGDPSLQDRLFERLRSVGCEVTDIRVDVAYVAQSAPGWRDSQFHVAFDRVAPVVAVAIEPMLARIEITVLRGTAERRTYSFAAPRIDFGRGAEVRDQRNRLLRTNHIVFVEGWPGENQTVSRRHAHIVCDRSAGDYRLHDDGSEHGTGIVRDGRTIPVPSGSRGVRVRSGDEIVLGEARMSIRIETPR